jgi:hypothetical protein
VLEPERASFERAFNRGVRLLRYQGPSANTLEGIEMSKGSLEDLGLAQSVDRALRSPRSGE